MALLGSLRCIHSNGMLRLDQFHIKIPFHATRVILLFAVEGPAALRTTMLGNTFLAYLLDSNASEIMQNARYRFLLDTANGILSYIKIVRWILPKRSACSLALRSLAFRLTRSSLFRPRSTPEALFRLSSNAPVAPTRTCGSSFWEKSVALASERYRSTRLVHVGRLQTCFYWREGQHTHRCCCFCFVL